MRAPAIALFCAGFAFATGPHAAEPAPETFVEVPPPPPAATVAPEDQTDEELEPEVTIIQRKDATYEEYRLNGRLYMVKVIPAVGPPYYFIDRDGDGLMESRMNDRGTQIQEQQWVIFSW
jgi:hypothetical protein